MLKNTNIIGGISEMMVKGYLVTCGYEVFSPDQGHTRADLVYLNELGKLIKVQVKTATMSPKENTPHLYEQCVLSRTHSAEYTKDEVDEFWIVGTHLWCFPFESLDGKVVVSLGTTNPAPRKTIRNYDPNDFIVVHGSLDEPYRNRLFQNHETPFSAVTNYQHCPSTLRKMKSIDIPA